MSTHHKQRAEERGQAEHEEEAEEEAAAGSRAAGRAAGGAAAPTFEPLCCGQLQQGHPASPGQIRASDDGDCAVATDDRTCSPLCTHRQYGLRHLPRELPHTSYCEMV